MAAGAVLGVGAARVSVLDHPALQDGMTTDWPTDVVAATVREHLDTVRPELVVTFDERGCSGHPNHVAVHHGTVAAMSSTPAASAPQLWTLRSVPWYLTLEPVRVLALYMDLAQQRRQKDAAQRASFVLTMDRHGTAHQAMQAHASQYVWYRLLHVWLGPYARVNQLHRAV